MCVCAKSLQLCPTLCDLMEGNLPGSSVHGILEARILEWVAMLSSRGSSWPRDWTCISCLPALGGEFFTTSTTWEALWNCPLPQNKTANKRQYCLFKGAKRQRLMPPVKTLKYAGCRYFPCIICKKQIGPKNWLQTARHLTKFKPWAQLQVPNTILLKELFN